MTFTYTAQTPILRGADAVRVRPIDNQSLIAELDALLDGVRRLAPESFHRLYELQANALNSFAYSLLRDQAAAEDAVQQAFLELVKAAPGIRGDGRSLRAWLYRSVRYRCLDELRRRQRRREDLHGEIPDTLVQLDQSPGGGGDLEAAMTLLTDQQRQVLFLRHVVGMSGHEVATVLQTNAPAVFATASRAERRLRKLLADGNPREATA